MSALDRTKKELRELPEESLEEVDRYIHRLQRKQPQSKPLPSHHLQGRYDGKPLRKLAYE